MSGYRTCLDCSAPVKFRDRDRCHICHRRAERAALKRACPQCGRQCHLQDDGRCAGCVRADTPRKPPKTTRCRVCGQDRRNVGLGLCNRCMLADPDRPFRYAASLANRMSSPPAWWNPLVEFTAARHHRSGTVTVLRETGRILASIHRWSGCGGRAWESENALLIWENTTCLRSVLPVQEGHLVDATLSHPPGGVRIL